jgi:hypothetical protein
MTLPLTIDRARAAAGVYVFDAADIAWQSAGKEGLALKTVREDRDAGQFLGLVGFEPMARSGLHQHQGVASSFFLDGSLTDYWGSAGLHQAGINLAGATHDAVAYQRTLLVSRLEAHVTYPHDAGSLHQLHTGSRLARVHNAAPEVAPDLNITVDALPLTTLSLPGVGRRMIFDYAGTGSEHRMVQLSLQPGTVLPPLRIGALTELWVRAGALDIDGRAAHANCFAVLEPGARVTLGSPFGALVFVWAEGPAQWEGAPAAAAGRSRRRDPALAADDLFGF